MRAPLYRLVVAALDLAIADVEHRCAAWRVLDALHLHEEAIDQVTRLLEVNDTGDERRAKNWLAWRVTRGAGEELLTRLAASDESRTTEAAPGAPSSRRLRLVRASSKSAATKEGNRT